MTLDPWTPALFGIAAARWQQGASQQRGCRLLLGIAVCLALAAGCGAGSRGTNVLLVSVDTLRADHLGFYGRSPSITPQLDALAAQGEVFHRAYAPAPFTIPSIAALLTGMAPESVGVTGNVAILADGVETLASRLREHGHRTAAVVSNYLLNTKSGMNRGFEVYDHHLVLGRIPERSAAQTTDAALARLSELRSAEVPFLLWVHYMDPHVPYSPPPEIAARHLVIEEQRPGGRRELPVTPDGRGGIPKFIADGPERSVAFYRAGYAGEVEYVDSEIGRLLAALAEGGDDGNTIVVFVADHGESLGEDDFWFSHGHYLSDALVRVPLIIRVPGRMPASRGDIASLQDIVPTLLAQLGLPVEGLPGRDLLAPDATAHPSEVLLSNYRRDELRTGLVSGDQKYLADRGRGKLEESVVHVDALGARPRPVPERIDAMRDRQRKLRAARPLVTSPRQRLSEEEREQLRALGYGD